jgi:hypothetical protein
MHADEKAMALVFICVHLIYICGNYRISPRSRAKRAVKNPD